MELVVRVCDLCREVGLDTKRYTVSEGERAMEVDLCNVHSEPLEALLGGEESRVEPKAAPAVFKPPAARTGPARGARKVRTLEEIAELKR